MNTNYEIKRSCKLQELTGYVQEKLSHAQIKKQSADDVIEILQIIIDKYKNGTLYDIENAIHEQLASVSAKDIKLIEWRDFLQRY